MTGPSAPLDADHLRRVLDRVGRAFLWSLCVPFFGLFAWPVLLWGLIDLVRHLAAGGRTAARWIGACLVLVSAAFVLDLVDVALTGNLGGFGGTASGIGSMVALLGLGAYASAWVAWCTQREWHRIAGAWRRVRTLALVPLVTLPLTPLVGRWDDGKIMVEGVAGGVVVVVVAGAAIVGLLCLGTAAESVRNALDRHESEAAHPVG